MLTNELLDFKNELLDEMTSGSGIRGLVEKMSALISKPVLITNSSYLVIAYSSMIKELREKDSINISSYEALPGQGTICWNNINRQGIIYPLKIKNSKIGYMIIFDVHDNDEKTKLTIEQAINILILEMVQQHRLFITEKEYKDAFLFDLLYGNINSKEDIISRAELWKWNLRRPHQVILFELEGFDQHSSDAHLMDMLSEIISHEITKMNEIPILLSKRGETIVIFATDKDNRHDQKVYKEIFVKKVLESSAKFVSPRVVRVGAGRIYKDPTEIFRSYQESKVALALGRIMNIKGITPSFSELGLTRILYNHDHQELLEFYKETLGELERYDSEQNSDFLNTLEKYLLYQCDLKMAADVLFLHPNTLRYRLKKIEEILDMDLDDVDTKLNLKAAFKIVYLLKAAGTEAKNAEGK